MNINTQGFLTYKSYVGLKNHFKLEDYDYHGFNHVNIKTSTYLNRKDKSFFILLFKQNNKNIIQTNEYLTSAFLINNDYWIGDILENPKLESFHKERIKRRTSLLYTFKNDMEKVEDYLYDNKYSLKQILTDKNENNKPIIIEDRNIIGIGLESLAMLSSYSSFCKKKNEDIIFNNFRLKINKYGKLLRQDFTKDEILTVLKPLSEINKNL